MSLLGQQSDEIYELKYEVDRLKSERRMYKKSAMYWMEQYDVLKKKYEDVYWPKSEIEE